MFATDEGQFIAQTRAGLRDEYAGGKAGRTGSVDLQGNSEQWEPALS